MGKKGNAVVFGLTANHTFAIACVMMDLARFSRDSIDEIVVLHDGIGTRDQELLRSILPCRFILYDFPSEDARVLQSSSVRHFTKMVFTKFECLRLLDDYKNVLWLDYDIVIQRDISELFEGSGSGIMMIPGGNTVRGQLLEPVEGYDMDREGVSAGTFVFSDNLPRYQEMYTFCYSELDKYSHVTFMPEQAVFDFMVQAFDLSPEPLDPKIYTPHPTDTEHAPAAKIIHSYGQPKFWNGQHNAHWDTNYRAWLDMGGSKYVHPNAIDRILDRLRGVRTRLRW